MRRRDAKICISQHPNRKTPLAIDLKIYKSRHLIENFFGNVNEGRSCGVILGLFDWLWFFTMRRRYGLKRTMLDGDRKRLLSTAVFSAHRADSVRP